MSREHQLVTKTIPPSHQIYSTKLQCEKNNKTYYCTWTVKKIVFKTPKVQRNVNGIPNSGGTITKYTQRSSVTSNLYLPGQKQKRKIEKYLRYIIYIHIYRNKNKRVSS